jgi:IS1 family transposase
MRNKAAAGDDWKVCPAEIAENDLSQGKNGTIALERNYCHQRHWFARFNHKSLVVSKSLRMVDLPWPLLRDFMSMDREEIISFFY